MATTPTTNRQYGKPTDGASADVWGVELNNAWDAVDADVHKLLTTSGYAADGGSANAYTATLDPAWGSYAAGNRLRVKIANANTGASTLNVNGLGAKNILTNDGGNLTSGLLKQNGVYEFVYDGTQFRLMTETARATQAQARAGTDAVAPLTSNSIQGETVGGVDVLRLGGYMLLGGTINAAGSSHSVTFPYAFGTAPRVTLTPRSTGATTTTGNASTAGEVGHATLNGDPTTNGFNCYVSTEGEVNDVFNAVPAGVTRKIDWHAFGKL